eukprot:11240010-Ditylum_brightwellii.AAC.1
MSDKNEISSKKKGHVGEINQWEEKWDKYSLPSLDIDKDNYDDDDYSSCVSERELCEILKYVEVLEKEEAEIDPTCIDSYNEDHEDVQFNNQQINNDLPPQTEDTHESDTVLLHDMKLIQTAASAFQDKQENDRYKGRKLVKTNSVEVECQTFSRISW